MIVLAVKSVRENKNGSITIKKGDISLRSDHPFGFVVATVAEPQRSNGSFPLQSMAQGDYALLSRMLVALSANTYMSFINACKEKGGE